MQGFDPAVLADAQQELQGALERHIDENLTDPSVGEIIGGERTIVTEHVMLAASMPYQLRSQQARYQRLPRGLQHRIRLGLGQDPLGNLADPVAFAWPAINMATSAGTYGYVPRVDSFLGIPRSTSPGAAVMDMNRTARVLGPHDANTEIRRSQNIQVGALSSALEHLVPEGMFSSQAQAIDGISATKALALARTEGQRIFIISQANLGERLARVDARPETQQAIAEAVRAGATVVVHERPVSIKGWSGTGYVEFRAETGDGAWRISGGLNGNVTPRFAIIPKVVADLASLAGNTFFSLGQLIKAEKLVTQLAKQFAAIGKWLGGVGAVFSVVAETFLTIEACLDAGQDSARVAEAAAILAGLNTAMVALQLAVTSFIGGLIGTSSGVGFGLGMFAFAASGVIILFAANSLNALVREAACPGISG